MINKRKTGTEYEERASRWLINQGMKIVARNYRCHLGEIDLIGYHLGYLVFIEVKYRKNIEKGYPAESVGIAKQRKICRVADFYRVGMKISEEQPVRYDVIGVCGEEIKWYQNAFEHLFRQ